MAGKTEKPKSILALAIKFSEEDSRYMATVLIAMMILGVGLAALPSGQAQVPPGLPGEEECDDLLPGESCELVPGPPSAPLCESSHENVEGGCEVWVERFNGGSDRRHAGRVVEASPDGSTIFVTGTRGVTLNNEVVTMAYSVGSGEELWNVSFESTLSDYPIALAVSPDGSKLFVGGASWNWGEDYRTIAYNTTNGDLLWTDRYDGPATGKVEDDRINDIEVSPDGETVFVTGYSYRTVEHRHCTWWCFTHEHHLRETATIAYDATTGDKLWLHRNEAPCEEMSCTAEAHALAVSPGGAQVVVTGQTISSGWSYETTAYNASTGAKNWGAMHEGRWAQDVVFSPDGERVYVTGEGMQDGSGFAYVTLAYNATDGGVAWSQVVEGPHDGHARPTAMVGSPDGEAIFVTGRLEGSDSDDYFTVAHETTNGSLMWSRVFDGDASGDDDAHDIGISDDGLTVFVTGEIEGESARDYGTLAYRATDGSKLMAAVYNGTQDGRDRSFALAVTQTAMGPLAIATGTSMGEESPDVLTVAYRPGLVGTPALPGEDDCDEGLPEDICEPDGVIPEPPAGVSCDATGHDAQGVCEAWAARFAETDDQSGRAQAIAADPDGSVVYVTGTSESSGSSVIRTLAYDSGTGDEHWNVTFDAGFDGDGHAIAVSPDGDMVFVTGSSFDAGSDSVDYRTIAYNASGGAELWTAGYDGAAGFIDEARDIGVSPEGQTVYVTGQSLGTPIEHEHCSWLGCWIHLHHHWDYATVAYDAADGEQEWVARYEGERVDGSDFARALAVSPDGEQVVVTGDHATSARQGYATLAYNASTGAEDWLATHGGADNERARDIAYAPDGATVFVTGNSFRVGTAWDYGTFAYDSVDGMKLWDNFVGAPGDVHDVPSALAVAPDGEKVYVTGRSWDLGTPSDHLTVALHGGNGTLAWSTTFDGEGSGDDVAHDIAVSADGASVFVTGQVSGVDSSDYGTFAYQAATGEDSWSAVHNGTGDGDDIARAMTVTETLLGPLVVVTGQSQGEASQDDFLTMAYRSGVLGGVTDSLDCSRTVPDLLGEVCEESD